MPKYPYLAEALQKHYQKCDRPKRLLFENKATQERVTLTGLAWKMRDLLEERWGLIGFDPPTFQHIVDGERRFSPAQLDAFCELLALAYTERYGLEMAIAKDSQVSRGFGIDFAFNPDGIDDHLKFISEVEMRGNAPLAVKGADQVAKKLDEYARASTSPTSRNYFQRKRGEALYIKAWALSPLASPDQLSVDMIATAAELGSIAKECNVAELDGLANAVMGDAYHIIKDCATAIPYLNQALQALKNPRDLAFVHRTLALGYSKLGDKENFDQQQRKLKAVMEAWPSGESERLCLALDGLTRAQSRLGLFDQAWRTLEQGNQIYTMMATAGERLPARELQFVNAELCIIRDSRTADKDYIKDRADEAVRRARDHSYRISAQIADVRNEIFPP
ncbi:MAG: hypothetical protein HY259_11725 [Chloroflexi bacterium]|nr:hypothetical protein [Chloroflexota bacterium]